jgi:hypothetical protein
MAYLGNTPGVSSQRVVLQEVVTGSPKTTFVATSGYTLGYVDVLINGVELDTSDFTAADGVNIVLSSAAQVGDTVKIKAWLPRGLSDGYLKSEADGRFLNLAGGVLTGQLTVGGNLLMSANSGGVRTLGMPSNSNTTLVIQGGAVSGSSANIELTNNNDCFVDATITRFRSQDASTTFAEFMSSQARILTGNVERMRVDSAGNVGIGNNNPALPLDVTASSNSVAIRVRGRSSDNLGAITFENNAGTSASQTNYIQSLPNGYLAFGTNNAERMRINSAGTLILNQGQIQFPATQNASSNANTLDDYEEGTWNASSVINSDTGSSVTFYNNGGTYTKIGRFVFLKFRVQVSSSSGTSIRIYGIPFTSVDQDSSQGTSLATRTANLHTVIANSDHIWLQNTNNYEYLYGMVIYQTN